ncbi:TonB-dependent receptor [Elongatibacter sediminis]|uniref:TonB-dependent receptor n=1 Tax=Elongatibacter sediminis TaxID=3119006 RepID=A0AAW9RJM9_9GAMM
MKYSQHTRAFNSKLLNLKPTRLALALLPASIGLALSSASAFAQDQQTESNVLAIEEVIVTAQRREENLQDVPISISAFTTDAIEKNMFEGVADYISATPNASFISNGSRAKKKISIRGVSSFSGGADGLDDSGGNTFGFYVDDFSVVNSTINPPIMDVERIEILRGPQATYFGRGAMGGGISVTTKKPDNELYGSVMLDYSRFDTKDVEGVVNIPVVEDVFAMRANVKYTKSDGNIKNINATGGGNESEYKYARLATRYTPTDNLTIDFTLYSTQEDVGMREGVPSGVFSTFAGDVLYSGFPDRNGDGVADPDPDGVGFYPDNRNRVNFDQPQNVGTKSGSGVLRIDYTTNDLLITSITGYISSNIFINGDIDGGSRDFFNEFRDNRDQSFSQELRIQNTNDSRWQWTVGGIYASDEKTRQHSTFVGAQEIFGIPEFTVISSGDSEGEVDTWAVFGQVDYSMTDALTVSLGARYTQEKQKTTLFSFTGAREDSVSADEKFTDFSPRLAFSYQARENINFYGTISKGFKAGGVQVPPFPTFSDSFDEEELWNYEIGIKTDLLNNRLRLNAALFYMDWDGLQVEFEQTGLDEEGNLVIFNGLNNSESSTSKGAELTLTALLSENLVANLSIGYLDAEFDELTQFLDGENRVFDGRTIPRSPKWTVAADVEYGFNVSSNLDGYVRAEWRYRDDYTAETNAFLRPEGTYPWYIPSYDFVNLRAGVEHQNFSVSAYVENLFDSNFYTNAYEHAYTGGMFVEPSFRTYGVRAKYEFR